MAITSKNQRLISYKKLAGKAHTNPEFGISNEAYPSFVQMASSFVFAEEIIADGTAQEVVFELEHIPLSTYPGSDTYSFHTGDADGLGGGEKRQDGSHQQTAVHGFILKLLNQVTVGAISYAAGTKLHLHQKLQIIPESFGSTYKPKVYSSTTMSDSDLMAEDGLQDWVLDCSSGILFMQDIYDGLYPSRVKAYVYTGKYLDEMVEEAASTGGDAFWSLTAGDPDQIETSKSVAINVPLGWNYIDLNFQIDEATKTKLAYIPEPQLDLLQGAYALSSHDRFDIRVGNSLNPSATIKNNLTIDIDLFGTLGPLSTFEIPKNSGTDRSMLIVNKPTNNDLWKLQGEAAVGQFWNSWTADTVFGGPTVGLFSLSGPKDNKFLFPSLGLYGSRGDDSSSSPIQSGDTIGRIVAYGNATSGQAAFSWKPAAWIEFAAAENFTSNDGAATIRFCTTDNASNTSGTNVTERFSISHNGNVVSRSSFYALSQGTGNTSNIHIRKDAAPSGTNLEFNFSHRSSGQELLLYAYNGSDSNAKFVTFYGAGSTSRTVSFPSVDAEVFKIDLIKYETRTNGAAYIYPTGTKSALYLERTADTATIKALDNYLIMDSKGSGNGVTALNYFVSDNVLLAKGGGNVGIGNIPSNQPDEMLEIYGDSPFIKLSNTAETESGILFVDTDDEINEFAKITFNAQTRQLAFYNDSNSPALWIESNGRDITTAANSLLTVHTLYSDTVETSNLNIYGDIDIRSATFDQVTIQNDQTGITAGPSSLTIINSQTGTNGIKFIDTGTPNGASLIQIVGDLFKFKNTTGGNSTTSITIHSDGNVVVGDTTLNLPTENSMNNAGSLGIAGDLVVEQKSKFLGQASFTGQASFEGPLKINQTADVLDSRTGLSIYKSDNSVYWNISTGTPAGYQNDWEVNRLVFYYTRLDAGAPGGSGVKGYIANNASNSSLNFTGQHRNKSDTINLKEKEKYLGLIVVSDGEYASIASNNIKINEALPKVSLASKRNQKSAFGVVSDIEDENAETREYALGNFVSVNDKTTEDTRLIINSLGEGGIWVTNVNGNLENGDYITTCEIPGYGMKQDDDLLHNYTVAKITCDCDFNLESPIYICEEFEHEGTMYKRAFVGCTYHCG